MNINRFLLSFIICHLSFSVSAKVRLPQFFSDNMVLQQQSECNIWGKADKGKSVVVITSWDKKSYSATVNQEGDFSLKVQTPKAGGPYEITFATATPSKSSTPSSGLAFDFTLRNVMIGEVWICAGQSNMEMQMKGYKAQPVENAAEELLACNDSNLRLFYGKRLCRAVGRIRQDCRVG